MAWDADDMKRINAHIDHKEDSVTEYKTSRNDPEFQRELAEARRLLDEAIAEKGEDYTYEYQYPGKDISGSCLYLTYAEEEPHFSHVFPEGDGTVDYSSMTPTGPSCIVGNVLVRAGVDMLAIQPHEGQLASALLDVLDKGEGAPFQHHIIRAALRRAQEAQDEGHTWGSALKDFELYVDRELEHEERQARRRARLDAELAIDAQV